MCAHDRWIPGVFLGLFLVGPSLAVEPRAELLAAEAERVAETASPAGGTPGWIPLVAIGVATTAAAFAGTYFGARRSSRSRPPEDAHAELTVARRADGPMVIRSQTLARLAGVLDDLEEIGAGLKRSSRSPGEAPDRDAAPPSRVTFRRREPEPRTRATPSPPDRRGDRRASYEQARRLLREGHDPLAVRAMTGLRGAEVDLLRAAPSPARRAAR
ncbi:MAG: hypothetical protein ACT4PE_00420 [Candidatus Eiseniibacteriota bacterium]